jgi:hypothetical protein
VDEDWVRGDAGRCTEGGSEAPQFGEMKAMAQAETSGRLESEAASQLYSLGGRFQKADVMGLGPLSVKSVCCIGLLDATFFILIL